MHAFADLSGHLLRLEIYEPQDIDYKAKYVVLWVLDLLMCAN